MNLEDKNYAKIEELLLEDLKEELELNSVYTFKQADFISQYWGNEMVNISEGQVPFLKDGEWDLDTIEKIFDIQYGKLPQGYVGGKILCWDEESYITIED